MTEIRADPRCRSGWPFAGRDHKNNIVSWTSPTGAATSPRKTHPTCMTSASPIRTKWAEAVAGDRWGAAPVQ